MHRIVYLHGFRSSPQSFKARLLAARLQARGQGERFHAPQLPDSPAQAIGWLESTLRIGAGDALIGSSLGGFYATVLIERHGGRAVLLNPAVDPADSIGGHDMPATRFHGDEPFHWHDGYLDELRALRPASIANPSRYLLVAATGDEVLDWRTMTARYAGARQRIIDGSDHGLSDFADYIDEVLAFCDAHAATGSSQ